MRIKPYGRNLVTLALAPIVIGGVLAVSAGAANASSAGHCYSSQVGSSVATSQCTSGNMGIEHRVWADCYDLGVYQGRYRGNWASSQGQSSVSCPGSSVVRAHGLEIRS